LGSLADIVASHDVRSAPKADIRFQRKYLQRWANNGNHRVANTGYGIPLLVVRTTLIPQQKDLSSSQVAECIHAVLALIAAFQCIAVPLRQIGCGCVRLLKEAE
jgi:hypothetical protein